jgi:hypothetical protein
MGHTSCIDCPRTMTMLCWAMICGFRKRTAARVRWNSDKLRIIAPADMMAMFAVVVDAVVSGAQNRSEFGVKRDRLASAR